MKKAMTFTEILRSEFYYLVEAIEHGCSDVAILQNLKETLFTETGYRWID